MGKYIYTYALVAILFLACNPTNREAVYEFDLVETDVRISFELDDETAYNFFYAWAFSGKDGREYFSFLNYRPNQKIHFYDFKTQEFLFKFEMPREGADGVFPIMGYYIGDFDNMYVAASGFEGLIQIDTTARIVKKIPYGTTTDGYMVNVSFWPAASRSHLTPVFIGNKLYITQKAQDSRTPGIDRPVSVVIDTAVGTAERLPFTFRSNLLTEKHFQQPAGGKLAFSREFDGKRFIYSFYGNEDIVIASADHQRLEKKKIKSRYMDRIVFRKNLEDPEAGTRQEMEIAAYGDLIYDKYREVYYRFAYPETALDPGKSYFRKSVFGRKKFSVIILDKNLDIVGETLFPEGIYNSYVYFVHKEGLYISRDYQIGEEQPDDRLNYTCFVLKIVNF